MAPADFARQEEFITIARVLRTQGRRGEVAAELHTGSAERFRVGSRVFALDPHGDARERRRELMVEDAWPHKGLVILKLGGVESISEAEALIGCEIQLPKPERLPLPAGEVYVSDLAGCAVFDGGREVGRISEVRFGSGDAPLLVVRAGPKEYLLPFAQAYLVRLDVASKRVDMALPEGMLELNQ